MLRQAPRAVPRVPSRAQTSGPGPKYRSLKVLGQGTFGKALLVEEIETAKLCVVKQISLGKLSSKEQKEMQQEASLLSTLNHPNIVAYIDSYLRATTKG
jgi:serine/threonine protein kinase